MSGETVVAHKKGPYGIFLAVAVVYWFILLLLYIWPNYIERTNVEWLTYNLMVQIGYLVIALCLFATAFWKITLSTTVQEVPAPAEEPEEVVEEPSEEDPPKAKAKPPAKKKAVEREEAAITDEELPEGLKAGAEDLEVDLTAMPRKVDWPPEEVGTVYADTPVMVDTSLVLNLRFPIGKVCNKCEELEACKRRVKGKLDEEVFLYNFECKDGLKRELQKARKARESEAKKKGAKEAAKGDAAKRKALDTAKKAKATEKKRSKPKRKASKGKKK